MRIAFDLSIQGQPAPTGVERAQATLLSALLALDADDELVLLSPGRVPERWRSHPRAVSVDETGGPTWLWRETAVPRQLRRRAVDVFHSPVAALPLRAGCPLVATIHEVPWVGEDQGLGDSSASHRLRLHLAASFAARLLCVSARTADHVRQLHPEAAARVRCVPHGVDPFFLERPTHSEPVVPDAPFLLAVGRLRRKKNLGLLVQAFGRLVAQPGAPAGLRLVLAGPAGDGADELLSAVAAAGLSARVDCPGFLDDVALRELYGRARAVVFPSVFEGFGLPVLEAMAVGTPVLASRQGAAPEAVGDAAILFDGHDADDFLRGCQLVLNDAAGTSERVRRGREHAAGRSAQAMARAVRAMYEELA